MALLFAVAREAAESMVSGAFLYHDGGVNGNEVTSSVVELRMRAHGPSQGVHGG